MLVFSVCPDHTVHVSADLGAGAFFILLSYYWHRIRSLDGPAEARDGRRRACCSFSSPCRSVHHRQDHAVREPGQNAEVVSRGEVAQATKLRGRDDVVVFNVAHNVEAMFYSGSHDLRVRPRRGDHRPRHPRRLPRRHQRRRRPGAQVPRSPTRPKSRDTGGRRRRVAALGSIARPHGRHTVDAIIAGSTGRHAARISRSESCRCRRRSGPHTARRGGRGCTRCRSRRCRAR